MGREGKMGNDPVKIELTEKNIELFWAKVAKKSDAECWEWLAYRNKNGYGRMHVKNKMYLTHRVAWFIHNGEIPDGLLVCHACDNPGCVNPLHMFLGTKKDNANDRDIKCRGVNLVGERHGSHKLTEKEVIEIREKYIPHVYTLRQLAKEYGVDFTAIHDVVTYFTWKHLCKNT